MFTTMNPDTSVVTDSETQEWRSTVEEINKVILEQKYFFYPALEIPEYGTFAIKITAPYDIEKGVFTGIIIEEESIPTQKYFDLKSNIELAVAEAPEANPHIIYVEIGEAKIALRIGQLTTEA